MNIGDERQALLLVQLGLIRRPNVNEHSGPWQFTRKTTSRMLCRLLSEFQSAAILELCVYVPDRPSQANLLRNW